MWVKPIYLAYTDRLPNENNMQNNVFICKMKIKIPIFQVFLLYCRDANDNKSINTPDKDNNTPLHIAAGKGKSENVQVRDFMHVIYTLHVMFPRCIITIQNKE